MARQDILGAAEAELMGEEIMGEDMMGEDLMGEDLMGARRRRGGYPQRQGGMAIRAKPPLVASVPGVQTLPSMGKMPLGFGALSCTAALNPSGGTSTARPQMPWRPGKLVIGVNGSAGYAVTVYPVIGVQPVLAGGSGLDASAFAANALDNVLQAAAAAAGMDVSLRFEVTPPVAGADTVILTATWFGDTLI